jgi:hypothetical protein
VTQATVTQNGIATLHKSPLHCRIITRSGLSKVGDLTKVPHKATRLADRILTGF